MDISDKIKEIRHNERLTQADMAEMVGLNLTTLKGYETGKRRAISVLEILKILNHPRFQKYIVWFVTEKIELEIKQISPMNYGD